MKRLMLMLGMAALSAMPVTAKAGGVYEGPAKGTSIVGVRLGLLGVIGANVTYDYALARVWKGTFTIGGQVGYMWGRQIRDSGFERVTENWNHLTFRVRTTYRFNVVVPEWEVYGGAALGGCCMIEDEIVQNGSAKYCYRETNGWISGAFILGTTYHFTDVIGLNLEFDLGDMFSSWINFGVNFRL